jgi:hypothetical protein
MTVEIRHIACGLSENDLFLTAEFERVVSVWSLSRRALVARFETVLDFGGRRLALLALPDPVVLAAAFDGGRVAAYDIHGEVMWERQDLHGAQTISPLQQGRAAVELERRSLQLIDASTGEPLGQLRGLGEVYADAGRPHVLGVSQGETDSAWIAYYESPGGKRRWKESLFSFGVLAAAFGSESVLVSEVAGPVRCFDLSGHEAWRWDPPRREHVTSLGWNRAAQAWVGVLFSYDSSDPQSVLQFDNEGSASVLFHAEERWETEEFFGGGDYVITSAGAVHALPEGKTVWVFAA